FIFTKQRRRFGRSRSCQFAHADKIGNLGVLVEMSLKPKKGVVEWEPTTLHSSCFEEHSSHECHTSRNPARAVCRTAGAWSIPPARTGQGLPPAGLGPSGQEVCSKPQQSGKQH